MTKFIEYTKQSEAIFYIGCVDVVEEIEAGAKKLYSVSSDIQRISPFDALADAQQLTRDLKRQS